jgi:dihydroxyacetone kinase
MSKHAKMMLHSPSGGAWGSAEQLRTQADQIDDFEATLIEMMADRLGMKKKEVKAAWFDGGDHWLNADEALAAKLIDGIVDGKAKESPTDTNSVRNVIDFYDKQITNYNHKIDNKMDLTKFIAAAKMQAGTTEEQFIAGIQAQVQKVTDLTQQVTDLTTENTTLKDKVKKSDETKVTDLVDNAITAKKITAEQKEMYTSLAKADFANTKKALDAMKGYTPIGSQFGQEGNSVVNLSDEEKKYTFSDFLAKAPQKLQAILDKDPEAYKKLYKDQYGKDAPKA